MHLFKTAEQVENLPDDDEPRREPLHSDSLPPGSGQTGQTLKHVANRKKSKKSRKKC